jgi:hypothetical protein
MKNLTPVLFGVLVAALTFVAFPQIGNALDKPLATLKGGAAANTVSCGDTATLIRPNASGGVKSMVIKNDTANAVYIGGSAVDTTAGLSVCNTGCDYDTVLPMDVSQAYCIFGTADSQESIYITWGADS